MIKIEYYMKAMIWDKDSKKKMIVKEDDKERK